MELKSIFSFSNFLYLISRRLLYIQFLFILFPILYVRFLIKDVSNKREIYYYILYFFIRNHLSKIKDCVVQLAAGSVSQSKGI